MNRVNLEAMYTTFAGWKTDISGVKGFDGMPAKMKEYIQFLDTYLKVPVQYISNGPGREQIVRVEG